MTYSQINQTKVWGFLPLIVLILLSGCSVLPQKGLDRPFSTGYTCGGWLQQRCRTEETNLTDWEKIYLNSSKYVPDYMDKQFEEIPEGETYCKETITKTEDYCDWYKGRDEKWRETCYAPQPIYKDDCFVKKLKKEVSSHSSQE